MADEYAQNLPDIPERTETASTDLVLVNSGGSDYKQTKANFTSDLAKHVTWSTSSTLVSQISALPSGAYYGLITSYGYQTATGMPENANFFVVVQKHNATNVDVVATTRGTSPHVWRLASDNTWIQDPTRAEITSLNNSLANSLKLGDWTENLTLPYTPTSDGFISVWLNPSSTSGAYARLSVTGESHAMGLNAKGGDGVTLVFPIKKNSTVSQAALSNGTLSVRFISIFG